MNNRFKSLRKSLKISQEEMGKKLGVGKSAISRMEAGDYKITPATQKLIEKEFNVNPTWFQTGEGEMFLKPSNIDEELAAMMGNLLTAGNNEFKKKFISAMMHLDDEQWDKVEAFANMILKEQNDNS